jgi:hypothetical protein
MRPFFLEAIFWKSASHLLLRSLGASRMRPYRVMVRGEHLWWSDGKTTSTTGGLFTTRVVMANSDAEARTATLALVRDAVRRIAGNPKEVPVLLDVEESNEIEGIVWRQPRGFSLFEEE